MGKFIIHADGNGHYHYDLKAANGEVIGRSSPCATKPLCLSCIGSVKTSANAHSEDQCDADHPNYPLPKYTITKCAGDGLFYFQLLGADGDVILNSGGYTAKESAIKGILSVGANAPDAPIEDAK